MNSEPVKTELDTEVRVLIELVKLNVDSMARTSAAASPRARRQGVNSMTRDAAGGLNNALVARLSTDGYIRTQAGS